MEMIEVRQDWRVYARTRHAPAPLEVRLRRKDRLALSQSRISLSGGLHARASGMVSNACLNSGAA